MHYLRILKIILLDIIPSFGDMSTDFWNAITMIRGANKTHTIDTALLNSITEPAYNDSLPHGLVPEAGNTTYEYTQHVIWGSVGLVCLIAPGIPLAISILALDGAWRNVSAWVLASVVAVCYPLVMLVIQLGGFCYSEAADGIVAVVAMEAFFESTPQLLLQLFTILNGYETTTLQLLTIAFSFFLLSKSAIMYDLFFMDIKFDPLSCDHWKYLLSVLPVYISGIIFRVGSMAIITAYLRYISLIIIAIRVVIYAVLAKKFQYKNADVPIAVIANLGSFTRGALGENSGDSFKKNSFRFIVTCTIGTLLIETTTLATILAMTEVSPRYFTHREAGRLEYFQYTAFIIVGLVAVGMVNLIFLYGTRKKLENPPIVSTVVPVVASYEGMEIDV